MWCLILNIKMKTKAKKQFIKKFLFVKFGFSGKIMFSENIKLFLKPFFMIFWKPESDFHSESEIAKNYNFFIVYKLILALLYIKIQYKKLIIPSSKYRIHVHVASESYVILT